MTEREDSRPACMQVVARLSTGVVVWNRHQRDGQEGFEVGFANDAAAAALGYSIEALAGKELTGLYPLELSARLGKVFSAVLAGEPQHGVVATSVDGTPLRVWRVGADQLVTVWEEPPDRARHVADELAQANTFLDSIVENLPAMIFVKDAAELRMQRLNRAGEELLGHPREEVLGRTDYDLFPPEQAAFFQEKDRETLRDGRVKDIPEEPVQTPYGTRWLHTKKIPIQDEAGVPRYLLGIAMDVTARKVAVDELRRAQEELEARVAERTAALSATNAELLQEIAHRKEAERALKESEERLRLTLMAIPQLVWTASPDGTIEILNQQWDEYLGAASTSETVQAKGLHPDDLPRLRETWGRSTATGERFELEYRLLRAADQTYRWHLGRAVPQRNAKGVIVQWFGTATDIDDQKRAEHAQRTLMEEAQGQRARAEEANRTKDQFLATVSHELRTPLTAILGWSSILRERRRQDGALLQKGLEVIQRNASAQAHIIDDILDVSRIMMGKLRVELQRVDANSIVQQAIDVVRPSAFAKEITLVLALDTAECPLLCDPDRLRQVAWNILANAVKFTPTGGQIRVSVSRTAELVRLEVHDSGQGIEARFLPHVFERFRQADGSATRNQGGLGLGLAIVRHLVEMHGGQVSVESPGLDQGATFTVELPLSRADRGAPPPGLLAGATPRMRGGSLLEGQRVLVVDDDGDSREVLRAILSEAGAAVQVATNAHEALQRLRSFTPDVLLSDLGMPGEDGFALIRQVRESGASTPALRAIAVTAYAGEKDEQQALAAGFDGYLKKPIEPRRLVQLLASLQTH